MLRSFEIRESAFDDAVGEWAIGRDADDIVTSVVNRFGDCLHFFLVDHAGKVDVEVGAVEQRLKDELGVAAALDFKVTVDGGVAFAGLVAADDCVDEFESFFAIGGGAELGAGVE